MLIFSCGHRRHLCQAPPQVGAKKLPPAHVRTQTLEEFCFVLLPQLADKTARQTFSKDLAGCTVAPLLFISAAIKVETMCVHCTSARMEGTGVP